MHSYRIVLYRQLPALLGSRTLGIPQFRKRSERELSSYRMSYGYFRKIRVGACGGEGIGYVITGSLDPSDRLYFIGGKERKKSSTGGWRGIVSTSARVPYGPGYG